MLQLTKLRLFKKNVKSLHSSIIVLKDAVTNDVGYMEFDNIKDNLDFLLEKADDIIQSYNEIFEYIEDNEVSMQLNLVIRDIVSMLKILKYSLKAKRSKIDYDDVFNCVNIVSRFTEKALEHASSVAKYYIADNITPFWAD